MIPLWLLVSSLLITAIHAIKEPVDPFMFDGCTAGSIAVDLDGVQGASQVKISSKKIYIFMKYGFGCDGFIDRWEFYAKTTGTFLALVFRPRRDLEKIRLIGFNEIKVQTKGEQVYEIPSFQRIDVITGDVIGLAFPSQMIVSMVNLKKSTVSIHNSDVYELDSFPEDLSQEEYLDNEFTEPVGGPSYAAAITAYVTGPSPFIRLAKGEHHSGVAELFRNGEWGRICDTWFHKYGWPNLFCKNLGFPQSEKARYVYHNEIELEQPLFMNNLRCKASLTKHLFDCHLLKNYKCARERQVFIECERKVRLVGGSRCSGVPEIWKHGTWNTVCDAIHELEWHKANPGESWTSTFCREMGCPPHATVVKLAKDDASYIPSVKPTYSNPTCSSRVILSMADCPRLSGQECNHNHDYYLKCGD